MYNIYHITSEQYHTLYTKLDDIGKLTWWKKILLANDERLLANNQERRLAKRRSAKYVDKIDLEYDEDVVV